ncbi:MAG: hypothetical protein KC776_08625 [Myxococcales bacterium]|nr:hypothetical protein [Myxococcales bacterium]
MAQRVSFGWLRLAALASVALGLGSACSADVGEGEPIGQASEPVTAPTQAYCSIPVTGKGTKSMEDDYLPHVIQCENGGANLQALKAQAIAARSVAYYNMATSGSICDGQGCQVYSCGATPKAIHYQAVKETAGIYLSYANTLTYGFYVAGDSGATAPSCHDYSGSTSKYVTYNEGKTGTSVTQTSLGYIGPPGFGQNRGCMSQWGARCLENGKSYDYTKILQFYYGSDIQLKKASGSCTNTCTPTTEVCNGKDDNCDGKVDEGNVCNTAPKGYLDAADCDGLRGWAQDPDAPDTAIDVHLYFDGPAGSGAKAGVVTANVSRQDLCTAIGSCEHGFDVPPPLSLFDGKAHEVHAYGIDTQGGTNPELSNSPKSFTCTATLPQGIRRHVVNPDSLAAWKFDLFWQLLPLSDAQIASLDEGAALPAAPELVKADDGTPEVWLVDGSWRRHVPDPTVMAAWGFAFGDVVEKPAAEVYALTEGPKVRSEPVLVKDSSGKVDIIDDPFPGTGGSGTGGATGGGGSGGTGGTGGGASGGKSGTQQHSSVVADDEGSGCGCRQAGGSGGQHGALMLLLAVPWILRRRRNA